LGRVKHFGVMYTSPSPLWKHPLNLWGLFVWRGPPLRWSPPRGGYFLWGTSLS